MPLNGLSIASARPTPQPCVSVLMVQEIQETYITRRLKCDNGQWIDYGRMDGKNGPLTHKGHKTDNG